MDTSQLERIDAWVAARLFQDAPLRASHIAEHWGDMEAADWWDSRPAHRIGIAVIDIRDSSGRRTGDLAMWDLERARRGELPPWGQNLLPTLRGRALGAAIGSL